MITLLWTKSNLPLSRVIRWATNDDCSHFAICFDKRVVFHSNFYGVHIDWFDKFASHCDIVHKIQLPTYTLEQEELVYQKAISITGQQYDYLGLLYFGWRMFLLKTFGKPLPLKNKWGSASLELCIEAFTVLSPVMATPENLSMLTPDQLFQYTKTLLGVSNGNISSN